jgi:hypothetical protein
MQRQILQPLNSKFPQKSIFVEIIHHILPIQALPTIKPKRKSSFVRHRLASAVAVAGKVSKHTLTSSRLIQKI